QDGAATAATGGGEDAGATTGGAAAAGGGSAGVAGRAGTDAGAAAAATTEAVADTGLGSAGCARPPAAIANTEWRATDGLAGGSTALRAGEACAAARGGAGMGSARGRAGAWAGAAATTGGAMTAPAAITAEIHSARRTRSCPHGPARPGPAAGRSGSTWVVISPGTAARMSVIVVLRDGRATIGNAMRVTGVGVSARGTSFG